MLSTDEDEAPAPAPVSLADAARLVLLDASTLTFFRHGATLRLTIADDRSYLRVSVLRAFPLSEPDRFLSIRDGAGKEIGLIVDAAALAAESRALVAADLERRYVIPVVTLVRTAKERFGTVDWTMETDRGIVRLTTRNLRENVQRPSPERLILNDVDGNRYDIRNVDALPRESQELLFRHI